MTKEELGNAKVMVEQLGDRTRAVVIMEMTHGSQLHVHHAGETVDVIALMAMVNTQFISKISGAPAPAVKS